jgi:hypothetical protein
VADAAPPSPGELPAASWFYGPQGWERAPHHRLIGLGPYLAATDDSGRADVPFALSLRDQDGTWFPAADAPFRNRAGIVQVAAGHRLVALLGDTAWVFDPAG